MEPNWVVVFDFDGTLIPKSYKSLYDVVDSNGGVTKHCRSMIIKMREKYLQKAHAGKLSKDDMRDWLIKTINLYVKSGLSLNKVEKILKRVKLRKGVAECFAFLKKKKIPFAIVSYGIRQFIEIAFKLNGLDGMADKIYATELIISPKKRTITGHNPRVVLSGKSKNVFSREFAGIYNVSPENILGVGDSSGDAYLSDYKDNILGIADNQEEEEKLKKSMGEVVITKNFYEVISWLKRKMREAENQESVNNELDCADPNCGKEVRICRNCDNFMPRPPKIEN